MATTIRFQRGDTVTVDDRFEDVVAAIEQGPPTDADHQAELPEAIDSDGLHELALARAVEAALRPSSLGALMINGSEWYVRNDDPAKATEFTLHLLAPGAEAVELEQWNELAVSTNGWEWATCRLLEWDGRVVFSLTIDHGMEQDVVGDTGVNDRIVAETKKWADGATSDVGSVGVIHTSGLWGYDTRWVADFLDEGVYWQLHEMGAPMDEVDERCRNEGLDPDSFL